MLSRTRNITWSVALVLAACGAVVALGPLDPPAGPVAPTYKTLTEVEPRVAVNAANTPGDSDSLFKITQRGSYYLTGNITGVVGKHGIEIVASGVTVDLNGFDLAGVAGSLDGVSATLVDLGDIAVVNGSVRTWGDDGVDLGSSFTTNGRVEGVQARGNAGEGIRAGHGCTLSNCSAFGNASHGVLTGTVCTISNCSARFNSGDGIHTEFGCTVSDCSATDNSSPVPGLGNGIAVGDGCMVSNCSASANSAIGIDAGDGCTVADCAASHNTIGGIVTSIGCTVTNSTASFNTGNGIQTFAGSTVSSCSAYSGGANGIFASASTVVGCTSRLNTLDGILCDGACVIRGNSCSGNGVGGNGASIHATNGDNRIEDNNCTGGPRGIQIDAAGNIIVRNTSSGHGVNWLMVANNVVGPIVDRTAPASAAINGNSAPDSTGSAHPNANFTY